MIIIIAVFNLVIATGEGRDRSLVQHVSSLDRVRLVETTTPAKTSSKESQAKPSRSLAPHRHELKTHEALPGNGKARTPDSIRVFPDNRPAEALNRVLVLSPKVPTRADETHSALLLTHASYSGNLSFKGRVQTVKQLRTGSLPNPWECAWVIWNYRNDDQYYYVAIKPNGWEVGKGDPAYPGGQRFIKTGDTKYAIGVWHDFEITQKDDEITVRLNGVEVAIFRDTERPYTSGKLGFYTEDAEIQVAHVTAPFYDNFKNYPLHTHRRDGHAIKNWFMPFLGYGYVAIADRKK